MTAWTTERRGARRAAAGFVLALAAVPVAWAAPPAPPPPPVQPCAHFAASPGFARDGTAFCAGHQKDASGATTGFVVHRTTDRGRSWTRLAAAGLLMNDPHARVRHLSVSPAYATDSTVFVQVQNTGLFQSTDAGTTFTLVSPLAWGSLTAYAATAPGGLLGTAGVHPLFVMASPAGQDGEPNRSAIVDPLARAHTPVVGTPGRDTEFAVSDTYERDGAAFAVADHGVGLDARVGIYRCNAAFACSEPLHSFPKRWTFDRIWLSAGFATTRTVYVSMTTLEGKRSLWWSRDAGKTWQPWTSAERLLAPVVSAKSYPGYALAPGPAGSRQLHLRVSYSPGEVRSGPPAEQLFRSKDGGATWQPVAYGRTPAQGGTRGTIPTNSPLSDFGSGDVAPGALTVTSTGHLFALGNTWVYAGFYCSWDAGRTWARYCRS